MLDLKLTQFALLGLILLLVAHYINRKIAIRNFQRRTDSKPAPPLKPYSGFLGRRWISENFAHVKTGTIYELWTDRFARSGQTYQVSILGTPFHFTSDAENVKAALTNLKDWGVAKRATSAGWAPFAARGIFVTDGHEWEASRAMVKPAVTKAEISQLDKVDMHVQRFLRRIEEAAGATVDVQKLFLDLTIETALDFLLGVGTSDGMTPKEAAERSQFMDTADRCTEAIFFRMRTPEWVRWFNFRANRRFANDTAVVHKFVDNMVARQAEKTDADKGERSGYVFANEMLRATGGDREQTRWELLSLLTAARDTTALLLSHTLHALARHPEVWKKLLAEVTELQGRKPDYDKLKSMRYLRYVLNETLRVYPVVANDARWATRDTTLPRGGGPDGQSPCFIAKGNQVLMSLHVLNRSKEAFGPDADEFRPERWYDESLRPGWHYIPFGGGPRVCPGQQFALIEASYVLVRLVQTFPKIENRDPRPYAPKIRISVGSAHGVLVGLKKE